MGNNLLVEATTTFFIEKKDQLKKKIKQNNIRLVFVSSPGNPYGKAWEEKEISDLIALAEELDFYIIFDAVYKDLYFKNPPFIPINPLSEKLFYVNSFSKMLSVTGWRIGYFFGSASHLKNIRSIHDYTGLCASSILQKGIAKYLEKHSFGKNYLEFLREKLKVSYTLLSEALIAEGFDIPAIDGGYFIWAKLPGNQMDGFQWAMNLYEQQKVAVIPGIHFSDTARSFVRINIAREKAEIKKAIEKIVFFCNASKND